MAGDACAPGTCAAVGRQLRRYRRQCCSVRRNRSPGAGDDGGGDAERPAARVHQGPPELPGLSGAVCWRIGSSKRPSRPPGPRQRAEHAGGYRGVKAQGIADGDNQLSNP